MSVTLESPAALSHYSQAYLAEYIGYQVIAVAISFIVLETVFVVLRSLARRKTLSPLGWDDYLIVPALVVNLGMCALGISQLTMTSRKPKNNADDLNSNGTPHRCRSPFTCSSRTVRPCEAGRVVEVHLCVNMDILRGSRLTKAVDPLSIPSNLRSEAPQDRHLRADGRVDRSCDIHRLCGNL